MSSHLPECPRSSISDKYADAAAKIGIHAGDCICEPLRACEQRVENRFHFYTGPEMYAKGYAAGLDAALKALVTAERRLHFDGEANRWIVEIHAIAAIDDLKEKRAGNPDVPPSAENDAIDALREDK